MKVHKALEKYKMAEFKIIKEALALEKEVVIKELQKELNLQKHIAKGTLRNGFYHKIVSTPDIISLYIMNDTPYMWLVNDGKSSGVNATYQAIADWTHHKEINGELNFRDIYERNNFINIVKTKLEKKYLTKGGESKSIAPRRYFFINFTRDKIASGSMPERLRTAIIRNVNGLVNKELAKKEIEITVS